MFRLVTILSFIFLSRINNAQTWHSVSSDSLIAFDMPLVPALKDTLNTRYYYLSVDTLLGFQVLIFKNTEISDTTGLFQEALDEADNDTLRAMVKLMIVFGGYELLSIEDVGSETVKAIEVGLSLANPDNNNFNSVVFIKLLYRQRNFISLTAASFASDIDRLSSFKEQFFNSLTFK